MMAKFAHLLAGAVFCSASLAAPAMAQTAAPCQLCGEDVATAPATASQGKALNIRIEAELGFGVAAIGPNGAGMIAIDPRTETRVVSGELTDLGGLAFSGVVRLSGQPFRRVRITLPTTEAMNAPGGHKAEITGFVASVPGTTVLDANGDLVFRVAGRFAVTDGAAGDFRGRISISAEYE